MTRARGLPAPLLLALYVLLALAPIALALAQGRAVRNPWREISSALAMVAFAMLLVEFVLSGRWRAISARAGIDATMRFHQLAARVLLVLLLAHPLLYVVPRLQTDAVAALASLQGMFGSPRLRSGVLAWALLIALVAAAILRDRLPLRYEAWRLSHGLGAAAVAALSLHHTLRVGTYAGDAWLTAFWSTMVVLALAALAHVYLLAPLAQGRRPWRLVENRPVAHRMWELTIEPESGPAPAFAAGQFVWLNLGHSPFSLVEHPFSISSAPAAAPRLSFTIKEAGDFTNQIGRVARGTCAYIDGPHGAFTLEGRPRRPLAFIAGGVGFAPVMGMLRHLAAEPYPLPVRLVYGNRIEAQILYRDELEALRERMNLEIDYVLSEPREAWAGRSGELDERMLAACFPKAARTEWLYFVCGPAGMIDAVERALRGFGVPREHIVAERFKYD